MDEKTAMTVEFLRARLLSERNVSRTARQRADVFAQRVMELEEQLRIVNSQRKKAEKAAEDVLAILETRGITYVSELTDSSAEQEDSCRSLSEDAKENDYLTFSGLGKSEVDNALPRSDIDGHLSEHKSLTWKFGGSRLDSQEKQKAKQNKHRNRGDFFVEVKPFQHRLGKSCRKIKRLDAGSLCDSL
ncbi:hypothetical protein HPP92_001846 [Vanilla planifolia]|uniref:Uncharacterized protein n=1 Tax=Vanilla planifolia TaxID=51239 RepID=A0A835VID5_VANPL|nr:hypothetical protein HPP92_001846 [Vanilla planifolia]